MGAPSNSGRLRLGLLLCLFVVGLDASIVNVLLPSIQSAFEVTVQEAAAVGTIYLAMLASLGLPLGRCADLFSANKVFLGGILLFGFGSLACGLSPTLPLLLLGRAIQGVGGAMLASSMGAVVFANIDAKARGKVLGGAIAVMSLGSIIGPPVGGFFAHHSDWSWAFFINVPICLLCFFALLPYGQQKAAPQQSLSASRFDLPGCFLSAIALLSFPAALQSMGSKGLGDLSFQLLLAVSVVAVGLLAVVEKKAAHPLLPLRLFTFGAATRMCLLKALLYAAFSGVMLVYPFYITSRSNLDASNVGWLLLSCALSLALLTPVAGLGVDRLGAKSINILGGLLFLFGALGASRLGESPSSPNLVVTLAFFGAASAFLMTASSVALLSQAEPSETGIFSAVNSLCSPVGGAIGFALFSAVYGEPQTALEHAQRFEASAQFIAGLAIGIVLLAALSPAHKPSSPSQPTPHQEEP